MNNSEQFKFLQNRLNDFIRSYNRNGRPVITDFLSVFEQKFAEQYLSNKIDFVRMPDDPSSISRCFAIPYYDGQLVTLKGTIRENGKPVTQRNVYGALMGLDIAPEKFGDVWMKDHAAYVTTFDYLADDIIQNCVSLGSASIEFERLEDLVEPQYEFDRKRMTVSAMRLDAIVKAATGVSREDAKRLVCAGFVKINHQEINSPVKNVESGDILSVRGYGRYKIQEAGMSSRSGRTAVWIDRFI
ncbi:MAG: hypothetical protein IIZ48_02635 [Erysipelotrichales bacterium]|nr:hypothetical protein [Erysipelotrichales bacterium]